MTTFQPINNKSGLPKIKTSNAWNLYDINRRIYRDENLGNSLPRPAPPPLPPIEQNSGYDDILRMLDENISKIAHKMKGKLGNTNQKVTEQVSSF